MSKKKRVAREQVYSPRLEKFIKSPPREATRPGLYLTPAGITIRPKEVKE